MPILDINTDEVVKFTAKLEKMHRSGLPVAVRTALNSAAFDVKKKTMPQSAASTFTQRKKNFFKATSRVQMAKGFNLNTMKSAVGFIGGNQNQAIRDLEDQEYGGNIPGRSFIPLDQARVSKNHGKVVRKANQLKNIRNVDRIRSKKDFHRKVNKAGTGGHVIYKGILFNIKSIVKSKVKLIPLYSYDKGRAVNVKGTGFMRSASLQSGGRLENYFQIEAKKQIKRLSR